MILHYIVVGGRDGHRVEFFKNEDELGLAFSKYKDLANLEDYEFIDDSGTLDTGAPGFFKDPDTIVGCS
jgi:hypothetical protein